MHKDCLDKLLAAKKLEMEALALLLPPGVGGHLQAISQEAAAMLKETFQRDKRPKTAEKTVQKVTID